MITKRTNNTVVAAVDDDGDEEAEGDDNDDKVKETDEDDVEERIGRKRCGRGTVFLSASLWAMRRIYLLLEGQTKTENAKHIFFK